MPEIQTACDCDTCQEMVRRREGDNLHDIVCLQLGRAVAHARQGDTHARDVQKRITSLVRQLRCCEESEVEIADRGEIH